MGSEVTLHTQIQAAFESAEDKQGFLRGLRDYLHSISPQKEQPVDNIRWVPVEMVQANDYNPNSVAKNEMRLLHTSISHDGYTQPVVTIWDEELQKYVIVDGFHRYTTMRLHADIREKCNGLLPIVVIDKPINDRMASTVRHNRARGKHSVSGMANMVFGMLENGWSDEAICAELGLEADELIRLKHVTGFSKLFENVDFRSAWETREQIKLRIQAERTKQAARRSAAAGGRKEAGSDLEAQYEDKAVALPTQEGIDKRKAQLEAHFENHVKKVRDGLMDVTCPHCGEDFMIEKKTAG